jgi:ABC-type methionine transport system ATPase subunit
MKVKRYKMVFPASMIKEPVIFKLSKEYNLIPNILRGRITNKSAWLELSIQGKDANLKKALLFLKKKGVKVEELGS